MINPPYKSEKFKTAKWLLERSYSQGEIAKRLGVSRQTIARWAKRLEREVYTEETGKLEIRGLTAILKRFRELNPISKQWLLQKLKVEVENGNIQRNESRDPACTSGEDQRNSHNL